ncbi:MAG: MBL fold metallo-hydrolase [Gammaproteobacteria bacterium]|nr:MBL fold metallo-hydrolase [Gammaproteobacteria bacterium]
MKVRTLLAVVAASSIGLWWYLFEYDALPARANFRVDWDEARALAGTGGPRSVHTERVAEGEFFGWMLMAGGGWSREPMDFRSYQLVYDDGQTIMIDAVQDRALHESMPLMGSYDDAAWEHQRAALHAASRIVLTHEHYDHVGGLAPMMNDAGLVSRMYITAAQRSSGRLHDSGFTDTDIAALPPADYTGMHRLAPGVVLIAAPGHTPGNQVVYVRMHDGAEYAFLGDIVWNSRNLLEHRAKSVLIGLLAGEDHAQLDPQIAWFARELSSTTIRFVITHDPAWNAALIERGLVPDLHCAVPATKSLFPFLPPTTGIE